MCGLKWAYDGWAANDEDILDFGDYRGGADGGLGQRRRGKSVRSPF